MSLPAIITANLLPLGALAPLGPPPGGTPTPGAPGGPASCSLAFTVQPQEEDNWCWSAVGISVAQFYQPAASWSSQCQLASDELSLSCCPAGSNPACDVPWYLDRALVRVGHFLTWAHGALSMLDIRDQIDRNRPLAVRIGWILGGGHFVVVSGYCCVGSAELVTVEDPMHGTSTLELALLQTAYRGAGRWTHSYWTQP